MAKMKIASKTSKLEIYIKNTNIEFVKKRE